VLATSHLQGGDLEESLRIARSVVETAASLKSFRVISYLDDFRLRLGAHADDPLVKEFLDFSQAHLPSENAPVSGRLVVA
jgi:hypothetical protein